MKPISQASHLTSASWEFESDLAQFYRQAEQREDSDYIARAMSREDNRIQAQHKLAPHLESGDVANPASCNGV